MADVAYGEVCPMNAVAARKRLMRTYQETLLALVDRLEIPAVVVQQLDHP